MTFRVIPGLLLWLGWAGSAFAQTPLANDLEGSAKDALQAWRAPGLAVAVVHDDRLVFLKGLGVRAFGRNDPVTADTVFPIASCTKSFTALILGMLADDAKLSWDDPVRKHLPYFRLADPLADREVALRDLLTHRTGVGSHDLLWYKSPWNLEERIRRTGRLELKHSFRSTFEYQTVFFSAAGEAAAKSAGVPWRDLVQRRILDPLGMKTARPVQPDAKEQLEQAEPHRLNALGRAVRMERYGLEQPDPAGSIHASARDLAKYLRFQLGDGSWQGKRLISAANLAEPHTPQIVLRLEGGMRRLHPDTWQMSYGMGWIVLDYRGHGMILHGGVIDGFRTQLTLIPKAKLGLAVLSNLDHTYLNYALSNSLVDRLLGMPYKDWNGIVQEALAKSDEERLAETKAFYAGRKRGTKPSLPLEEFVGRYEDVAYGPCDIKLEKRKLVWHWGRMKSPLEHFHEDMFVGTGEILLADVPFQFQAAAGQIASFRVIDRVFRRTKAE